MPKKKNYCYDETNSLCASIIICKCRSCTEYPWKVFLRDGSIIEGEMKEFVPSDYVILNLSGIETRIPLSQVAHIDNDETHSQTENTANTQVNNKKNTLVKDTLANYKGFY